MAARIEFLSVLLAERRTGRAITPIGVRKIYLQSLSSRTGAGLSRVALQVYRCEIRRRSNQISPRCDPPCAGAFTRRTCSCSDESRWHPIRRRSYALPYRFTCGRAQFVRLLPIPIGLNVNRLLHMRTRSGELYVPLCIARPRWIAQSIQWTTRRDIVQARDMHSYANAPAGPSARLPARRPDARIGPLQFRHLARRLPPALLH